MSDKAIQQVLQQMRAMKSQAGGQAAFSSPAQNSSGSDFASVLQSALSSVNQAENNANHLKTSFELGDKNVSLAQVMVASQKAQISTEMTVQIRNKLLQAYHEIKDMPI